MFLAGQKSTEVTEFNGPQQALSQDNLGPTQAIESVNTEYNAVGVQCRRGYVNAFLVNQLIVQFYNWISPLYNRFLYSYNGGLSVYNIQTGVETTLASGLGTTVGTSFAQYGNYVFCALQTSAIVGAIFDLRGLVTRVVAQDPSTPANVYADPLWAAPPSAALFTSLSATLFGAGSTTAGVHNVAVVITTRTGQVSPPIPLGTVTFASASSYTISITVSAAISAVYYKMQIALTTAGAGANGRYYIIPDTANNIIITGGGVKTLGFALSDLTLSSEGEDTTPFSNNFFQGQLIQGLAVELKPRMVQAFEQRMVYLVDVPANNVPGAQTESALLISDAGLPQSVGLARSIVQLPGALPITSMASLRGALVVWGPSYTYVVYSASGDPVTWATAQKIDGQIGALAPDCVCANVSKGIIWVANPSGLWCLNGSTYIQKPISWYCTDWSYIEWNVAYSVKVIDYPEDQTVRVTAVINHPTYGTADMTFVFNYQNGISAEAVQYSLHSPNANISNPGVNTGSVYGFLQDSTNKTRFAKTVGSRVGYQRLPGDANLYLEMGLSAQPGYGVLINSRYVHAPLPPDNPFPQRFNGIQMRVTTPQGGVVTPSVLSKNLAGEVALPTISGTGADSTQAVTTRLVNKQSEGLVVKLAGVGGWALNWLKVFWTELAFRR